MSFTGLIIGFIAFLVIGIFHPIVIKGEYYFGIKIWPVFLIVGILCGVISIFIKDPILSSTVAIIGFSSLWSIIEIKEQVERVKKGWFPKNPKRNDY